MIALVGAPALQADAAVIPEGIYAGERSLGGMEEDDALTAVEEYVPGLAGQQITMDVNGVAAVTTAQELGFSWSNRDQVKADLEEYTSGNVIRRYFKKKDLEKTPQKVDIRIKLEGSRVAEFVQNQCEPLVQEAVDATIHRENGTFVITPSQTGLTVDQNATGSVQRFKQGHRIALLGKQRRAGQTGRAGADDSDLDAIGLGFFRHGVDILAVPVGDKAL